MRAFHKTIPAGALVGLCMLLGCDSATDSYASPTAVGTWKGIVADSTLVMVFKSDLTFTANLPNAFGTYTCPGRIPSPGRL
jgi:hypothetical protein